MIFCDIRIKHCLGGNVLPEKDGEGEEGSESESKAEDVCVDDPGGEFEDFE